MEEDIKEESMTKVIKTLEQHLKNSETMFENFGELAIEYADIERIRRVIQENNNYKAAALKNDDYYKEVCNKNKELEKAKNQLKLKIGDLYRSAGEYEKAKSIMTKELREYIPKSLIKEKIEELDKQYRKMEQSSDFIIADTIQPKIEVLQELLRRRGEVRCVNIVRKKNDLKRYKKITFIYKYTENI